MNIDEHIVPETLHWCREHYVPPVKEYMVPCEYFGNCDGMSGGCWWCMEMMPYRWHMCQDEGWISGLTSRGKMSREKAIDFIEEYKQRNPLGDERRSLMSDEEWMQYKACQCNMEGRDLLGYNSIRDTYNSKASSFSENGMDNKSES